MPLPLLSMPHACKKCGRLKKSRPTAQTFYNGAKVRYFFRSCKFPLKNLRKMSFTSLDLFGACWMRSSTSKSKLIVRTFVVLPLPFGVLFHLLFVFSSCSIIFSFYCLFCLWLRFPPSVGVSLSLAGKRATSRYFVTSSTARVSGSALVWLRTRHCSLAASAMPCSSATT